MDFKKILNIIKENKKFAILGGVVLLIVIFLIISGGGKNKTSDALGLIDTLHNESYVADGTITISDKSLTINATRADTDYNLNLKHDDIEYNNIFLKSGNVLYFNNESLEVGTGLITLNLADEEDNKDAMSLYSAIFDAISNCETIEYNTTEESQYILVKTTENWKGFWTAIKESLTNNKDAIASSYASPDTAKELIDYLINNINKFIDTTTIANTLEICITPSESNTEITFDLTIDTSIAPDFVNQESIDSNKLKIEGDIVFTPTDAANVTKPSGAIHVATSQGVTGILSTFWENLFKKSEYVSFNQVSVTSNCVEVVKNLGTTKEVCQIVFNNDGVETAAWYITSIDEAIIDAYMTKYNKTDESNNTQNCVKIQQQDGTYALTIAVSKSGINSLNKISQTPKGMGEYFNSAKGVDIIV